VESDGGGLPGGAGWLVTAIILIVVMVVVSVIVTVLLLRWQHKLPQKKVGLEIKEV
jgi:hypothetical protein